MSEGTHQPNPHPSNHFLLHLWQNLQQQVHVSARGDPWYSVVEVGLLLFKDGLRT